MLTVPILTWSTRPHQLSISDVDPRLLASHYMIAIAYHVTLEETQVGEAAFGSVLAPRLGIIRHETMGDMMKRLTI